MKIDSVEVKGSRYINLGGEMKRYKLLKDLPGIKAGTVSDYYDDSEGVLDVWGSAWVGWELKPEMRARCREAYLESDIEKHPDFFQPHLPDIDFEIEQELISK